MWNFHIQNDYTKRFTDYAIENISGPKEQKDMVTKGLTKITDSSLN